MAMSLHGIFASFYREEFIEITKYKDSQAMYKCLTMVYSNVSATIICKKGVGKPVSLSDPDDFGKQC